LPVFHQNFYTHQQFLTLTMRTRDFSRFVPLRLRRQSTALLRGKECLIMTSLKTTRQRLVAAILALSGLAAAPALAQDLNGDLVIPGAVNTVL
jgi:hypothetical protein